MATEVIVAPLYQGSEISTSNRLRLATSPASKKALSSCTSTNQMDPARTKLTTIETKRIISVLDETIRKVELVTLLSAAAYNPENLEGLLEDDIIRAIQDHEDFCNTLLEMENLVREEEEELAESRNPHLQLLLDEHKHSLMLLKEEVKGSARNTLRIFLLNLQAGEILRTQIMGRSEEASVFLQHLIEFRGFVFEKLLTSPMEEKEKNTFMEEIHLQEKKNYDMIQDLEAQLSSTLKARDAEMEKENFVIKELKSHLHQVLKFSENHLLRTKQEAEKQQKAELRASQGRVAKIQQDIHVLRTQYHNIIEENRDSEQTLRKTEYEELAEIHTEEKAQLAELKEKHTVLIQEFVQIREERLINSKKKLEAEKELALMVRAATLIQAFWKGYLVRSLLKSKRKKKKGRGRGKK
ncbi:dynein regulatory complex protein 10 isoform X2 [Petaurus breviceps papuanus]|uniref:dynein regulatory complex protein 10 isoform X2 n=1 Tax=Petaurus breviceps papuanus TaxID=3040969 RepID=UPI0036DE1ACC